MGQLCLHTVSPCKKYEVNPANHNTFSSPPTTLATWRTLLASCHYGKKIGPQWAREYFSFVGEKKTKFSRPGFPVFCIKILPIWNSRPWGWLVIRYLVFFPSQCFGVKLILSWTHVRANTYAHNVNISRGRRQGMRFLITRIKPYTCFRYPAPTVLLGVKNQNRN